MSRIGLAAMSSGAMARFYLRRFRLPMRQAMLNNRLRAGFRSGPQEAFGGNGVMLPSGNTYEEVYNKLRWDVPDRYNIARMVCDRHDAARLKSGNEGCMVGQETAP